MIKKLLDGCVRGTRGNVGRRRDLWAALTACLLLGPSWDVLATELVSTNAVWRYFKGKTEASLPDEAAWRSRAFNDSNWLTGAAPFYYGEALVPGTLLSDMSNAYSTVFLRRKFMVTKLSDVASLAFSAVCDDGFIAWINGVRIASLSSPGGEPLFNSLASANAAEPVQMTEYELSTGVLALIEGENVLAIQVFNVNLTSSDIVFDAQLRAVEREQIPPTIVKVSPAPGVVSSLTSVSVEFSESVRGVDASDFFVNGAPATAVVGSERAYTFSFEAPSIGSIQCFWNTAHGITDLATPPNGFNGDAAGSVWLYELADPDGPVVNATRPAASVTVRQLSEVEVLFNEPVFAIKPTDLLINGRTAAELTGAGAGPYVFHFIAPSPGEVAFSWAPSHQIRDESGNRFQGASWRALYDPSAPLPDLVITEFMEENGTGLKDEEQDTPDWIEIYNRGDSATSLGGWSLTDDKEDPGRWIFPAITLAAKKYLVVFASAKNRTPVTVNGKLHTNFKLGAGEFIGLYSADSPRLEVSSVDGSRPEQRPDFSYGRDPGGSWRFYSKGTPGAPNPLSVITGSVEAIHFSVKRGYFNSPFAVSLSTATQGSTIRYTTNGSLPSATNGVLYTDPIQISSTRVLRAAGFADNLLPSRASTHTYLYGLPQNRRNIPVISLTTATNNLYGATGIMESSPRNTTKHGLAWERPVSVEYIRPDGEEGFALEAGLRVQGGAYIRGLYNYRGSAPPAGKYSFRLYFRGDYGSGRLNYRLIHGIPVTSFDSLVLRAGMNDPTNPFVVDELVRRVYGDTGQPSSHGMYVHLFLNGQYKGYYNPTERIDEGFLKSWHGGRGKWDVIAQGGEVREGDGTAWNSLKTMVSSGKGPADPAIYTEISKRLDLVNYVDYLLANIYAGTGDWPHNNWRAAKERVLGGKYRFYIWDAEWAFENQGRSVGNNTLTTELGGDSEIATFYKRLKLSAEFRQLFADRVHKQYFNGGALTDERIKARAEEQRAEMGTTISGFRSPLSTSWLANRRKNIMNHMNAAKLLMSSNAPALIQFGGRVASGFPLVMTNLEGTIYFTVNGTDPRVPILATVSSNAIGYLPAAPPVLTESLQIKARALAGTNWSALVEASFQVEELGTPIRISEILYNPPGGDAFEFVELANTGRAPAPLAGLNFGGIDYRFSETAGSLAPGAKIVLSSSLNPALFSQRYPGVAVFDRYGGTLSNGGEKLSLKDRNGNIVGSVDYKDSQGWPTAADGLGYSLELLTESGDPNDPNSWQASALNGGSPGLVNDSKPSETIVLNEILTENLSGVVNAGTRSDWAELRNLTTSGVDLTGWSLSDGTNLRKFLFPAGSRIPAGGYLVVWCDTDTLAPGFHTGFALSKKGDSISLYDSKTNRVDGLRFGPQIADVSLGRIRSAEGGWAMAKPTPGGPNEAAQVGSQSGLIINEYLANAITGEPDWLELYNSDKQFPVDLFGMYLGTSTVTERIMSHIVVLPSGFVQLFADEGSGPENLDFKLPAAGGSLVIHDSLGSLASTLTYGSQMEGVSEGRIPDGTGAIQRFTSSASPGAKNYLTGYDGPLLNEVLVSPEAFKLPNAGTVAWVELYNPKAIAFDLSGMSMSVNEKNPGQWVFPAGSKIQAGGFLVLRCDPGAAESTKVLDMPNLGRGLLPSGGGLFLFNVSDQLVDSVNFGFQITDLSIGKSNGAWGLLSNPTPGASNATAPALGDLSKLRLNEWMAAPRSGTGWLEIYNSDTSPLNMEGLALTDNPSIAGQTNFVIGSLSFITAGGWVVFEADGRTDLGPNHLRFNLDELGGAIRLSSKSLQVLDSVDFGSQAIGVSQGRLPDGGARILAFPGSGSPGEANYALPPGLVVSEVLAHTDPPLEDALELANTGQEPLDISGWFLSNAPKNFRKYRIPDGTVLAPGAFLVLYEFAFNRSTDSANDFTFNAAHGDEAILSSADAAGNFTGLRLRMPFGASENGVSFGRYETSVGPQFVAMDRRSFGVDTPQTLQQFRLGRGGLNSSPKVGPLVISEIHYSASDVTVGTAPSAGPEFIELYNPLSATVALFDPAVPGNRWKLANAIEFEFPGATVLGAGEFLLVVGFDPAANPALLSEFRRQYAIPTGTQILGPFKGKLNNDGDSLELYKPDPPQQPPHPDAGFVPAILVERIAYSAASPWPFGAVDQTRSLQRLSLTGFGNEPRNWLAAVPTPGKNTRIVEELDADKDGIPDDWERAHGLNPAEAADASLDEDKDGMTNLQEFLAGTDPFLRESTLRLSWTLNSNGAVSVEFIAQPGKSYSIERRDAADVGTWELNSAVGSSKQARGVRWDIRQAGFYRVITPKR